MDSTRLTTPVLLRLLLLVVWFRSAAVCAQNTLQITYPPEQGNPSRVKDLYPNQYIKFTWTSTWPNTSLYIFQGPNSLGNTAYNKLEDGVDPSVTEYAWNAHKLTKKMDRGDPFWLYLYNTNKPNCDTCTSNSTKFYIRDKPDHAALKIGLGVGLGVGIPLLAAIIAVSVWLSLRRIRQQQHRSQTMLLHDTPMSRNADVAPISPGNTSAAPMMGYVSSMEKSSPMESDGRDVVELPPNAVQIPIEAPVTRERVELEGDHVDERDVKDAAPER